MSESPAAHIPASPGPYSNHGEVGPPGPAAVIQVQHGHFLITMSVQTTFKPSAVLPTIYALLPQAQLQCDHIDLQLDEANNKIRVQIVGVTPANNQYAVPTLVQRLKALQPGATVVVKDKLSQLSVDSDSIAALTSLLMSSQSRALLDQHIHYYRLHSHPAFVPQLLIYLDTRKLEHVLNIMRNFMADPAAGGAVKPPRPSGLELKGDEVPSSAAPVVAAAAAAPAAAAGAPPATPEKASLPGGGVPPSHRGVHSSSRSPHFKSAAATAGGKSSLGLPPAAPLESALSANALAATFNTSTNNKEAPTGPAANIAAVASTTPSSSSKAGGSAPAAGSASVGAGAGPALDSHGQPLAPRATSVAQTTPIRIDNKWWSSRRADLLTLFARQSMAHDALFVYSLPALQKNIDALKALKSVDRIFFACKSNHHPELLRAVHAAGLGFECVSIQELKYVAGLFPGLAKDRLLFTPNFAAKIEYEEAYFYTDLVTLDNVFPLEAWPEVFKHKQLLLRVDPGEGLGYHEKMQTGGEKSKFGVSVEQMTAAIPLLQALHVQVVGLHVHKGSGIHSADAWAKTGAFLAQFLPRFPDLRFLDLGGGLGVQYKDTDAALDLTDLDAQLAKLREGLPDGKGKSLQLWLEPGRFVAATAGVLLARVTQLKSKPGRSFVGLSTGMNSLLRPALYDAHHDIVNLSRLEETRQAAAEEGKVYLNSLDPRSHSLVDVVGPICESGDVLGFARSLPTATAEGDVVLVDTCGAYGRTMSSEYNMRPPAGEFVLDESE